MADTQPLEHVLETAAEEAEGEKVSVGDLLDLYSHRSFGPIFLLLGLLTVVPPLGGIPGLPAAVGVVILLFSLQMIFGAEHIWLPDFIEKLSIKKDKIETANEKSKGVLKFIDQLITERLEWATSGPAKYVAAILVSVMALAMIPLELVPFAVAIPGTAICMVGVALLARDGALMLLAYALSAIAIGVLVVFSPLGSWLGF
ncbi:exopolysaccharide biosynthesis protein [Ponticaulis profundi]|uniref:Exopolysaccharide biosynthesis protein n=1 Tax=Ponticaulis profundi TaxID=2665222 RepID=A0ABW1S4C4_9PROT